MKDFKTLRLGEITLPSGEGELALSALEMHGTRDSSRAGHCFGVSTVRDWSRARPHQAFALLVYPHLTSSRSYPIWRL